MYKKYSVSFQYHSGYKKGQTILVSGIEEESMREIPGEITQDQLANSEIVVTTPSNQRLFYEDFVLYFMKSNIELH